MTTKPNFFIVGAPKCGTTAISEYLRSHPNVFMSKFKEPHFFSSDLDMNRRTLEQYLDLFAHAGRQQTIIAEASTTYLFSQVALPRIREFNPDAKILVMLRRPDELAYAIYGQCFLAGIETETDFERAWELQDKRAAGAELPPGCPSYKVLQYKWMASIGSQVQRLLQIFPRSQVHIILMDDLVTDPRGEYLRLLSFLGLPDDGRMEFPRVNEARSHKCLWLGHKSRQLRRRMAGPFFMLREKTGFRGTGLIRLINYFNTEKRSRSQLSIGFRHYLAALYADEIDLLEKLIGRDLSAWRYDSINEQLLAQDKTGTGRENGQSCLRDSSGWH